MKKIIKIAIIILIQSIFCTKDNKSRESKNSLLRRSIIGTGAAAVGTAGTIGLKYLAKKSNLASKVRIKPFNKILQKLEQNSIKNVAFSGALLGVALYGTYQIYDYFKTKKIIAKALREEGLREEGLREEGIENLFLIMPDTIYYNFFAKETKENNDLSYFLIHLLPQRMFKQVNFHCLNHHDKETNNLYLEANKASKCSALYIINYENVDKFEEQLSEKKEINPYKLYENENPTTIFYSDLICYNLPVIFKNGAIYISEEVTKETLQDYRYNFSEEEIHGMKQTKNKLITPQVFTVNSEPIIPIVKDENLI